MSECYKTMGVTTSGWNVREQIHKSLLQAVFHRACEVWFSGTLIPFAPLLRLPLLVPALAMLRALSCYVHPSLYQNTTNLQQINFYEVKKEFCYMISISSRGYHRSLSLQLLPSLRGTIHSFSVLRPLIISWSKSFLHLASAAALRSLSLQL